MALLIAEIGQNHCGDMELAKKLIRLAKENGADLVKFQLYDHKKCYGDNPNIPNVELSFEQTKMLFEYGKEIGAEVFFSVFDVERVKWCEEIGVKRYKLATTRKTNRLVDAVLKTGKPVINSHDGLFPFFEWEYKLCDKPNISWLLCAPIYPAQISDIRWEEFNNYDGLSDHTIGLDASKIALARGAKIIEKHFAIDHKTGVDAEWSMLPSELKELRRFADVVAQVL